MANNIFSRKNVVLVVEDELINIKILVSILSKEHFVLTAKSGEDAIRIAKKSQPDLILLDVMLGGMDGFETIQILKKDRETDHIPVIFLTGLNRHGDEEKGLSLGAVDYIHKPFSPTVVKLRVNNHLYIVNQKRFIERLINKDPLTYTANKRFFNIKLAHEWTRHMREKSSISLIMIRLADYEAYRREVGNLQAEMVLRSIAQIIESFQKSPADIVARYDDSIFAVLLFETNKEEAGSIANLMQECIEELEDSDKLAVSRAFDSIVPGSGVPQALFIKNVLQELAQPNS